ncbi:MAG: immunogenic protein [Oscillospiraceae bacterium]
MKKFAINIIAIVFMLGVVGCSSNKNLEIINAFEITPSNLIEKYVENSKEVTSIRYYELSDGTWKTDQYAYKYKLTITGRLSNAVKDITYTILSNSEDITFEQAWKASGLSSNLNDYFKEEDAVFVATKME